MTFPSPLMMNTLSRRHFLQMSAAGLAAATLPCVIQAAPAAAPSPFQRTGQPILRLSLAAYSVRENFPMMRGKPNTKVPPGIGRTDTFTALNLSYTFGVKK